MTSCNSESILVSFVYYYTEIQCIEPDSGFSEKLNFGPKLAIQYNA